MTYQPSHPRVAMTLEQCWHRVPGGTAVAAIELARALDGTHARIVGVAARHRLGPDRGWVPPVEVHHLPLPRSLLYESWHRLRTPSVQSATGPVELIHATSIAMPPRSAPLVVTIHDLAWRHERSHFTTRGVAFFERGLKLALRDADLVLCSSEATRKDCAAAGFEQTRLRVVPLGADVRPARPEEIERVRSRYRLTRPYILWVGTIEPRKNLPRLLKAFEGVSDDIELILVGPSGWNEDLAALKRERVRMLGFVSREDLGPLYAGARLFCFPSLLEGFGFPVLEAMAQGTPVVTSRGTSTEELAAQGGLLVDPHDIDAIRDAMRSIIEDDELARKLADEGRERAATYTWARSAELVAEAYRNAIERGS